MELIPFALMKPKNSLGAFNLAAIFFRPQLSASSTVIDLRATVESLSKLLLEYCPSEVASVVSALPPPKFDEPPSSYNLAHPGSIDVAAFGLVNLLHGILCASQVDEAILETLPSE